MTSGNNIEILTGKGAASIPATGSVHKPEFIRLPPAGQKCTFTGLSRSALNALILPAPGNNFEPPVRSFVLRQRGAKTGIRLIDFENLVSFIRQHED
jgi:hypothetical protein